jgi:hypothetical protein
MSTAEEGNDVSSRPEEEDAAAAHHRKGKRVIGESSGGAIARRTTNNDAEVVVEATDGKSTNCCVNPLDLVAYQSLKLKSQSFRFSCLSEFEIEISQFWPCLFRIVFFHVKHSILLENSCKALNLRVQMPP